MVELLWFLKMETLSDFIAVINESGELQMGPGIIIMTFKVSLRCFGFTRLQQFSIPSNI